MKASPNDIKKIICERVVSLPNEEALLISVFNTIELIKSNPKYFDELNGKYFKALNAEIKNK